MATLLSIDETLGLQQNDTNSPLPAALDTDLIAILGAGYPLIQAAEVNNALSGLPANVTDIAFTDSTGAALSGVDSGLKALDGRELFLYTYGSDNNLVIAREGTAGGLADPSGTPVFALYLQSNGSPGDTGATSANLWAVEFSSLQHPDATNPNDFVELANKLYTTITNPIHFDATHAPSGSNLFITYGDGTPTATEAAVVVTAVGAANQSAGQNVSSGSVVKTSQAGASLGGATFGVNSQMFDPPSGSKPAEAAYFTFVKGINPDLTVPNLSPTEANLESNIQFTNYIGVTKVSFVVSQLQPSSGMATMEIYALVATPQAANGAGVADDTVWSGVNYVDHQDQNTSVNITKITIHRGSSDIVFTSSGTQSGITVNFNPGNDANAATIAGLLAGDKIIYEAPEHDRLEIQNVGNASASLNASFDIGGLQLESGGTSTSPVGPIDFYDDGPTVTASATGAQPLTVDESNFAGDDTKNYAAQFTPSYGRDGPGASLVTYALSTPGGDSGLIDTLTGHHVFLFLESGQVVGRQGTTALTAATGDIVFVVSVDSSANVTLDGRRAVVHTPDTGPDQSTGLTGSNLVVLNATAHDGDGDTGSAPLDLTSLLVFKDDAPTLDVTSSNAPSMTVDESTFAINDTESFSGQFTPHYGADGPAGTPVTYALSTPGGDSGLIDTLSGHHVFLFLESGQVVGRQGTTALTAATGDIVFVVSVDGSGSVTLDGRRAVVHTPDTGPDQSTGLTGSNLVVLNATAHDGDGDTASQPLDLTSLLVFKDDAPTLDVTSSNAPPMTVDESNFAVNDTESFSGQFTPHYGADGPGATPVTYALSTPGGDSGLIDTLSGHDVFLFSESGQIVGRQGTDAASAATGDIVFVVSVDGSGNVTLDGRRAVVHTPDTGPDQSTGLTGSNLVVLSATVHDGDGDTASQPLDLTSLLNFKDDAPTISLSAVTPPSITDDESNFAVDNSASYAANFTPVYGADGPGATPVTYAISATASADSGLKESGTGNHVFLFNEGGTVVGRAGTNALTAATGDIVFVASIDASGNVTLDQRIAVVHDPNTGPDQSTTLSSAGLVVVTATAHDGDADAASTGLNIGQLINFKDDAPAILSQIQGGTVEFAPGSPTSITHSLNGSIGADGTSSTQTSLSGTAEYTISYTDTTPTNVFPNLTPVLSGNGTILTYYSDATLATAVYQLTLDPTANSGAGSYTFSVLQPPPIVQTQFGFQDLPSGQNLFGIVAVNKANINNNGTPGNPNDDYLPDGGLLVFPSNPVLAADGTYTNTSGTINTSQGGGGVTIGNGNQAFDNPGEGAYFMFVDNPNPLAVGGLTLNATSADDADTIRFNGVNQAMDASVKIVQASGQGTAQHPGPSLQIQAFEANPGNVSSNLADSPNTNPRDLVNNPTIALSNEGTAAARVSITEVKIHDSTGKVIEDGKNVAGATQLQDVTGDGQVTAADNAGVGISFIDLGGGTYKTVVGNLKAGYSIEYLTASNHDLALVQNLSGSYDIGGFNVFGRANVPAQDFHFAVTITDYDNDAYGGHLATFADFAVHVDGVIFA